MQKKILPITLLFISATTLAQPTLTSSSNPVDGSTFTYYICDSVGPGSSGANVTWDFSTLNSTSNLEISFKSCPFAECDTFTGSNITNANDNTGGQYFIANANKFAWNGEHVTGGPSFKYTDERDIRRYPFTMSDTYTDTHLSTFSSVGYPWQRRGEVTVTADAYGTLQLPNYTHTNVLRMHYVDLMTDSALAFPTTTSYIREVYEWWVPGQKEYLLHVEQLMILPSMIGLDTTTYTTIIYTDQFPAGINEIADNGAIKVYPVPAHDNIYVELADYAESIVMTDIVGKTVATTPCTKGQLKYELNTSNLPSGIYFIRISTENGMVTRKVEIQ